MKEPHERARREIAIISVSISTNLDEFLVSRITTNMDAPIPQCQGCYSSDQVIFVGFCSANNIRSFYQEVSSCSIHIFRLSSLVYTPHLEIQTAGV